MEKLLSPSALAMDWRSMQLGRCNSLRFRASGDQRGKIIENRVQHLGAKGRFFVVALSNGASKTLWETSLRVFWSSRSLIQKRAPLFAENSMNRSNLEEPRESLSSCGHSSKALKGYWGIISLLVVVACPQSKQVSLMVYPVLP